MRTNIEIDTSLMEQAFGLAVLHEGRGYSVMAGEGIIRVARFPPL